MMRREFCVKSEVYVDHEEYVNYFCEFCITFARLSKEAEDDDKVNVDIMKKKKMLKVKYKKKI